MYNGTYLTCCSTCLFTPSVIAYSHALLLSHHCHLFCSPILPFLPLSSLPPDGLDAGEQPVMTEEKVQAVVSATANCAMEVSLVVLDILDLFGDSFKVGVCHPTGTTVSLVCSCCCVCVLCLYWGYCTV